ncbi:hypothetical protein ACWEU6_36185 [Streptosporangium sandarakinum]
MALVRRDDIAALLPATAPGAPGAVIHLLARTEWPTIRRSTVLALLSSLVTDGLAVREDGTEGHHRYHLGESR